MGRGCPGKGGATLEFGKSDWVSGQKQPILHLKKKCQGCISTPETVRISIWHPVRFVCAHVLHRVLVCEKRVLDGLLLLCKIQFQLFKLLIALCFPSSWVCVCVLSLAVYFISSKAPFVAPICLPKITSNVLTFMHHVWAYACQDTVMVRCN